MIVVKTSHCVGKPLVEKANNLVSISPLSSCDFVSFDLLFYIGAEIHCFETVLFCSLVCSLTFLNFLFVV